VPKAPTTVPLRGLSLVNVSPPPQARQPWKLIFGRQPYFDLTRRNMKNKIEVTCPPPFFNTMPSNQIMSIPMAWITKPLE
jgi:hypothetical protein